MEPRPDPIAVADAALDRVVALQAQIDALSAARAETLVEFEEALTVPVQTLLGGAEPGTLEGVGPIDAATARKLTARAPSLYRLLTDPHTAAALSMSRSSGCARVDQLPPTRIHPHPVGG